MKTVVGQSNHHYLLLLGGNIGDVRENLSKARALIAELGEVIKVSSIYETQPWGFGDETDATPIFLNQALELAYPLEHLPLLEKLQKIEIVIGRNHKTVAGQPYSSRCIDIDILLCNNIHIDTLELTIPHKLMHLRAFALRPAAELWGDWNVVTLDKTIAELYSSLC